MQIEMATILNLSLHWENQKQAMIKTYERHLSLRIKYEPELDIIQQNHQTLSKAKLNEEIQKDTMKNFNFNKLKKRMDSGFPSRDRFGHSSIQRLRLKTIDRFRSKSSQTQTNYNKWYIKSDLRYKKQTLDPKKDLITLKKDDYLYENLHNPQFWDWMHPLQGQIRFGDRKRVSLSQRVDNHILEKFKTYMQGKGNQRLPMVVRSALVNKI